MKWERLFESWHFPRRILIFLALAGPGIITANVDNDAPGIATYSLAGAHYGYKFIWYLIPITIALIVIQEMSARMGVVTQKGLSELIRENFGVRIAFYILLALFIANIGNAVAEFAGIAASLGIFGLSKYISVPLAAIAVWHLIVKGTYKSVEKVFLVASLFYITYIISAFMVKPDWNIVAQEALIPNFSLESGFLIMLLGIIGTTIAPWMQFYLQSSVIEKGVNIKEYKYVKWDVIIGSILAEIVVFSIIFTCASTLYLKNIPITDAADAAVALQPLAGNFAKILFAFGLFNASIFAAAILPLTTAYFISEGMGWESGVNKSFTEAPWFMGIYTILLIVGAGLVLIPGAPLIEIMFASQVINGILLPFIIIFILLLINKSGLMGNYVNSKSYNIIAWATSIFIIVATLAMVVLTIMPNLLK